MTQIFLPSQAYLGILTFLKLWIYMNTMLLYLCTIFHNKLPLSFKTTFKFNHQVQTIRQTRQSNLLFVPRCRSCFSEKLPVCRFPNVWNKLNNAVARITDRETVKTTLKSRMINSYLDIVRCKNSFCKDCFPWSFLFLSWFDFIWWKICPSKSYVRYFKQVNYSVWANLFSFKCYSVLIWKLEMDARFHLLY